jgi:phosphoenolpyruvate-protein phosphotransferase
MSLLKGIPVSPGYAEAIAVVYDFEVQRRFEVPRHDVPPSEIHHEYRRLDEAVAQSSRDLERAEEFARTEPGSGDAAAILSAHALLVREVAEKVQTHVRQELVNVEQALEAVINDLAGRLGRLKNAQFREREQDVRDVGRRMLRHLIGAPPWPPASLPAGSAVVARELLPSEAVELARSGLVAIVAEQGGKNSHTAILARSLGIPAVTGIAQVTARIKPGMHLLVDGCAGEVLINPSPAQMARFSALKREYDRATTAAAAAEALPCLTREGIEVSLLANLGRPEEVEQVGAHGLGGVGLFRTEFLFLESRDPPSLQIQLNIYQDVAEALDGQPLVIRTFDLGGDKTPLFLASPQAEPHPSLALRGLRFSLAEGRLFETQLRAIVQVAQGRKVRVLFPMVVGHHDLSRARAVLDAVIRELDVRQRPLLGAMIETPAALFALEEILELVDFLAIGTNDLTQYMLALDRDEAELSEECTPWHPAVLRAISQVLRAAAAKDCPVCVCGEEAGEPDFACLLVGLGVRELSLSPGRAARVRQALRSVRCRDMEELAQQALGCSTPQEVREHFAEFISPVRQQTVT